MKRITVATLFALATFLVTGNAFSQSSEVRVNVPFNFTVGSKALPAGNYAITPISASIIQIQNRKTHATALAMTAQDHSQSRNGNVLVFDKAAGHYFLHAVLCGTDEMTVKLPVARSEQGALIEQARLRNQGGKVLLAAK